MYARVVAEPAEPEPSIERARVARAQLDIARERLSALAPLPVGLLAFALGLVRLTGQPFSPDEQVSVATAQRSVSGIWHAGRETEAPHVVYYLLLKPWIAAFGTSDWVVRFPSAVFGGLTALVLAALGARLLGRAGGVLAGLALCTNAYVVHWWQWARGYSLALLLATTATYAFVRALGGDGAGWRWSWAAGMVAAAWVNLFALSALGAHALALAARGETRRRLLAPLAAAAAGAAPIVVLVGTADNGQLDWIPPPTVRRVAVQTWDWAGRNPFALVAACAGLASLVALRPRALRWQAVLAGAWLAAPFAVTLVLSAFQPAFDAHYLSAGSPGLALGVAAALVLLPRRLALPLGALVAAGAVLQLVHFYLAPGKPLSSLF